MDWVRVVRNGSGILSGEKSNGRVLLGFLYNCV